jgi:hypothetical protein
MPEDFGQHFVPPFPGCIRSAIQNSTGIPQAIPDPRGAALSPMTTSWTKISVCRALATSWNVPGT